MLQIIGLFAISWLLIWLFEKKNLSILGLTPTNKRLKYFTLLFLVSALFSASGFLLKMYIAKEECVIYQSLNIRTIILETWYQFRGVLTEELLCRGALLYILIKKIGQTKAVIISSIFFAVLHWLNASIWGNLTQMIIVFSFTFAMGLLLAYSYARTFSLLIPFAIHYGWNLTQNYIFTDNATGSYIFTLVAPDQGVIISYLAFFIMLLFPKISVVLIDYFIVKLHVQVEIP